jgi:hypothetical protein
VSEFDTWGKSASMLFSNFCGSRSDRADFGTPGREVSEKINPFGMVNQTFARIYPEAGFSNPILHVIFLQDLRFHCRSIPFWILFPVALMHCLKIANTFSVRAPMIMAFLVI